MLDIYFSRPISCGQVSVSQGSCSPARSCFLFTCQFTEVSQSSVEFTNSVHSDCQRRPDHAHRVSSTCRAPCLPRHHPPLSPIPLPSAPLEINSPRTMITPRGLEDFKRQFQQEGVNRYELRHLYTVQTVIEQWIVSSDQRSSRTTEW